MSQVTQYICDGCGRPCGNNPHITMLIQGGEATGIALPPKHPQGSTSGWSVKRDFGGRFTHFHNGDCAKKFFDKLLAKYTAKKNERKNNS